MFLIWILFFLYQYNVAQKFKTLEPTNWTSCDEFLKDSTPFNASSLFNIDWRIFFFWNNVEDTSYIVRFREASPLLVDRFKVELKGSDESIDWDDVVMFMETAIDFSALYLKTEVPGKFRLLSTIMFQTEKIEMLIFALKLVPPGYLGIMNCKYRLCYALAPIDKMPEDRHILSSATSMGFSGDSNYSYLGQYDIRQTAVYAEDDVDDDEQMEVETALEDDD